MSESEDGGTHKEMHYEYNLGNHHEIALEFLEEIDGNSLLDIGCGVGKFTQLAGRSCCTNQLFGIDVSEEAVSKANQRGIIATCQDINEHGLPYESSKFDVVVTTEVIEHIYNTDKFLSEINRVLDNEGTLIITTMNLTSLYDRLAIIFGYQPATIGVSVEHSVGHISNGINAEFDHIRPFSYQAFKGLLDIHGFEIEKMSGREINFPPSDDTGIILSIVDKFVSKVPSLSVGWVAQCKKRA